MDYPFNFTKVSEYCFSDQVRDRISFHQEKNDNDFIWLFTESSFKKCIGWQQDCETHKNGAKTRRFDNFPYT